MKAQRARGGAEAVARKAGLPRRVQPKLEVGRVDDPLEREADEVADRVMRMPAGGAVGAAAAGEDDPTVRRTCAECRDELVRRAPVGDDEAAAEGGILLRSAQPGGGGAAGAGGGGVPPPPPPNPVPGEGTPLEPGVRRSMEGRFGTSFAGVRVHTGPAADESARSIDARAYTLGRHVVFGAGRYRPDSSAGGRLLAHELTHVVQQGAAGAVIRRDPDEKVENPSNPTEIVGVDIFLDRERVLVRTKDAAYWYSLAETSLKDGESVTGVEHEHGNNYDPPREGTVFRVTWKVPGPSPHWKDYPDSVYTMRAYGSSKAVSPDGAKDGQGTGKKGEGTGDEGKGEGEGKAGKPKPTEAEIAARLKKITDRSAGDGKPAGDREKLKELLAKLTDAEVDAFLSVVSEIERQCGSEQCPTKSYEELLAFYENLSPPDREALAINQMMRQTGETTGELPEQVLLAVKTEAQKTAKAAGATSDINQNLAIIHAKLEGHPELQENFDPIDPASLSQYNTLLMLKGMLAGAAERSPAFEAVVHELIEKLSEVEDYILTEILWLAAEMAALEVAAILTAPISAGTSMLAGAAGAALLIRRIDKFRRLLEKLQDLYAVVQHVQEVVSLVQQARNLDPAIFDEYRQKAERLRELRARVADADAPEAIGEEIEKAEDELLAFMQDKVMTKLGGVLENLYLPPDATPEELQNYLFDIPPGIDALDDTLAARASAEAGNADDSVVLALKGFRAGYLLAPFVAFLSGFAADKLDELMQDTDLMDRVLGIGGKKKGKRAKMDRKAKKERKQAAEAAFGGVKSNKERRREAKKAAKKEGADAKKEGDPAAKKKDGDGDAAKKDDDPKKKDKSSGYPKWDELRGKLRTKARDVKQAGGIQQDTLHADVADLLKGYGAFKPRQSFGASQDKPHHQLVVRAGAAPKPAATGGKKKKKKGPGGPPPDLKVSVLKTDTQRYKLMRAAIRKKLENLADDKRTREYVLEQAEAIAKDFERPGVVDVKDVKGSWSVRGAFRGGNPTEIIRIDPAGAYWGSVNKPVPIQWPKRALSKYEPLYIGPNLGSVEGPKNPIDQSRLEGLQGATEAQREVLTDELKASITDATIRQRLEDWAADGDVREYVATRANQALPAPSRSSIGVASVNHVKRGWTFQLEDKGSTTGADSLNNALKSFGFSPSGQDRDADHVWEHHLGGDAGLSNLWPLDSTENSRSGSVLNSMKFTPRSTDNPPVTPGSDGRVSMDQFKRLSHSKEVHFRVTSTNDP